MPGIPPSFINERNQKNDFKDQRHYLSEDSIEKLLAPPSSQKFPFKIENDFLTLHRKGNFSFLINKTTFFIIFFVGLLLFFGGIFLYNDRIFSENRPKLAYFKAARSDFITREKYLDLLDKELLSGKRKEFSKSSKIKVLWGKGGFGKSEIAIDFANRNFSKFSLIWTFYCDTQEQLEQGYRDIAERLSLCSQQEPIARIKEKVHFYLENSNSEFPWLIIYDNLENELLNFPQRGGIILVTSQKKVLNSEYLLEVTSFSKEESLMLLEKITGEKRGDAMEKLAEDLEGIPLLVSYAGHYIKATPGCNCAEYQKLFSSSLLKNGTFWEEPDVNKRYLKSLGASWQFPLKALEKENPKALELLYVCSYLHPENICVKWIDSWLSEKNAYDTKKVAIERSEILKILTTYGVIRYENVTETFSLHRFFQHMIRETRKLHLEEDLGQAVALLANYAVAMDFHFKKSSEIKEDDWWYIHACEAHKWMDNHKIEFSKSNKIHRALLYKGIAIWCDFNERYPEGLEACCRALDLRKSMGEQNTPELGILYDGKGWLLYTLDRYVEALDACFKALEIQKLYINENPLDYARTNQTLNTILCEQGEYEKALEYGQAALKFRVENLGHNDVRVSKTIEHISRCFIGLSRYQEAAQACDEALEIYKQSNKIDHPWYVFSLVSKGWAFFYQENYKQALKIFLNAQSHNAKIVGKFADLSSGQIECLNGIGWCHIHLGNYKKARRAFDKCLNAAEAKQVTYGKNDRLMIEILDGIGWSYIKEGQKNKGLVYLKQKLEISSRLFQNTPRMVSILENYVAAQTFNKKDKDSESEERKSL